MVIERVLSINCILMSVGGLVTPLTMSGFLLDETPFIRKSSFNMTKGEGGMKILKLEV